MNSPSIGASLLEDLAASFPFAEREMLPLIATRCKADLELPMEAMGSGSWSTLKRVTALRMTLEGSPMAEIVAASGLSEGRISQVLKNAQTFGTKALYPRFRETLTLSKPLDEKALWKATKAFLEHTPSRAGLSEKEWRPSTVADYLVYTGVVEDACVGQIALIIARFKDKAMIGSLEIKGVSVESKLPFTFAEPKPVDHKRIAPFRPALGYCLGFCVFTLCMLTLGGFAQGISFGQVVAVLVLGLSVVLLTLLAVKETLEWWLLQRVLASSAGSDPASLTSMKLLGIWWQRDVMGREVNGRKPSRSVRGMFMGWLGEKLPFLKPKEAPVVQATPTLAARATNPLGMPKVTILHAGGLPEIEWDLDRISDVRNAMGLKPVPILYLWVFDAQEEQAVFETHGWPQLGPVHLLLNSTALPLKMLMHSGEKVLLPTPESVDAAIAGFCDKAGVYPRPELFQQIGLMGGSKYEGYPIHTPVCTDGSWEHALKAMAGRCDLAVVNLAGYDPSHPGLEYEIRHLLSGGPPKQFLFTYDEMTDADAVIRSVLDLWMHLPTPPRVSPELVFLRTGKAQTEEYECLFRARGETRPNYKKMYSERAAKYVPLAGRAVTYLIQTGMLRAAGAE